MEQYLIIIFSIASAAFIGGIACLVIAKQKDKKNYIIQKVTPISLSLVTPRDDVWLTGSAKCEIPAIAPYFTYSCLYYKYTLEEEHTRTVSSKNGGTRTETYWETIEKEEKNTNFQLIDGKENITIHGIQADFQHLLKDEDYVGDYRHTVHYYPYPAELNAIGSISENKTHLQPYANIPLIITTKNRDEYIESTERTETILRLSGLSLIWLGLTGVLYGFFDYQSYPIETQGFFKISTFTFALLPSTLVTLIIWSIHIYNRFIAYRNRINNAWRQVDVDLTMRYQLIPQLVNVVKGVMTHEKKLLIHLVDIRNDAIKRNQADKIRTEGQMLKAMNDVLARIEAYPTIRTEPVIQNLNNEIIAIEEKIAHGRNTYNEAVKEYNDVIQVLPNAIIAIPLGLKPKEHFTVTLSQRITVSASY